QIDLYIEALGCELATLQTPASVDTIFLGGGTPTHLSPGQLTALLRTLTNWWPLNPGGEFSIEANPDTLADEKITVLAEYGVNRVSLGAQSFESGTLAALDRAHNPDQIAQAVDRVRRRIAQVS